MATKFTKDPDETLWYELDWSTWLVDDAIIDSYTVDAETGLTVEQDAKSNSNQSVRMLISGGELNRDYSVSCKVTADDGNVGMRRITIEIDER